MSFNSLSELEQFRKLLHSVPELSGKEKRTAELVKRFITPNESYTCVENIAGKGLGFIYKGKADGPTVLIRAELDALPINEINSFSYKSVKQNIGHMCGHDGHMTILAGIAKLLSTKELPRGKVILLFQPAEETGQGAKAVIKDKHYKSFNPDYSFALHNLPGYETGEVIIRNGIFASASSGLKIKLIGKTSHAAHPEDGNSPANAIAEIINQFNTRIIHDLKEEIDFGLITIIHVNLGEKAFGTAPGKADIFATLRAYSDDELDLIKHECVKRVRETALAHDLKIEFEFVEEFPSVENHPEAVEIIEKAALRNNIQTIKIDKPFKWTEDFGHFSKITKCGFFGIGSGVASPQLHNPDYDFPDALIPTGIKMFETIIDLIME